MSTDRDHVECKALYYPNYVVHDGVRQYYDGIPEYIQVSGHKFIERQVLEHFTMLSVLSWTSSTNAAHIYQQSMAKLSEDAPEDSRFRLRAAHTADGFLILALLKDAKDRGVVLEVPSTGHQKDRFTAAARARNARITESGQPEFAHWCTKCVRRFDDADGVTRTSLSSSIFVNSLMHLQDMSTASSLTGSTWVGRRFGNGTFSVRAEGTISARAA